MADCHGGIVESPAELIAPSLQPSALSVSMSTMKTRSGSVSVGILHTVCETGDHEPDSTHGGTSQLNDDNDELTLRSLWQEAISSSHFICDIFFAAADPVRYEVDDNDPKAAVSKRRRHLQLDDPQSIIALPAQQLYSCGMDNILTIDGSEDRQYFVSISNCNMVLTDELTLPVPSSSDAGFRWKTTSHQDLVKPSTLEVTINVSEAKKLFRDHVRSNGLLAGDEREATESERGDGSIDEDINQRGSATTPLDMSHVFAQAGFYPPFHPDLARAHHEAVIESLRAIAASELDNINRALGVMAVLAVVLAGCFGWTILQLRKDGRKGKVTRSCLPKAGKTPIISVPRRTAVTDKISPLTLDSVLAVQAGDAQVKASHEPVSPCSKLQAQWTQSRKEHRAAKSKAKALLTPSPVTNSQRKVLVSPKRMSFLTPSPLVAESETVNEPELEGRSESPTDTGLETVENDTPEEARPRMVSPSVSVRGDGGQSFVEDYWGAAN